MRVTCLNLTVAIGEANSEAHIVNGTFKRSCTLCDDPHCFFDCFFDCDGPSMSRDIAVIVTSNRRFNGEMETIERLIEFHAGVGVQIDSDEYQLGLTRMIASVETRENEQVDRALARYNVTEGEPDEIDN